MLTKLTLLQRILLLVLGSVLSVFLILILYVAFSTNRIEKDNAFSEATLMNLANGNKINGILEDGMAVTRSMAQISQSFNEIPAENRRVTVNNMLTKVLENNPKILSIWSVWEPNALDGMDSHFKNNLGGNETGRFGSTFCKVSNGIRLDPSPENEIEGSKYYGFPKKSGHEELIAPYFYKYEESGPEYHIVTLSVPIYNESKFLGVVATDFNLSDIQEYVEKSNIRSIVYSSDGSIAAHFIKEKIGKTMTDAEKDIAGSYLDTLSEAVKGNKPISFTTYSDALKTKVFLCSTPIPVGKTGSSWSYVSVIPLNEALANARSLRTTILLVGFISLLGLGLLIYFISHQITLPIKQSAALAQRISEGDLTGSVRIVRHDEIGQLSEALNNMSDRLNDFTLHILKGANSIVNASQQMNESSQQISQTASVQASSVENISWAMQTVVANIHQNNENAQMTEKISFSALKGIETAKDKSDKSLRSAEDIAEKISIVNDIAFQTNILALNAAVEAARAGDQGRGFAVVASEVRKLAEKSKIAADEIVSLSSKGKTLTEEAGSAMKNLLPEVQRTSDLVREIASAGAEQQTGVDQINDSVNNLNEVAKQNASASDELAMSARELFTQAQSLIDVVSFFKTRE